MYTGTHVYISKEIPNMNPLFRKTVSNRRQSLNDLFTFNRKPKGKMITF